jgi:hypothetical protein
MEYPDLFGESETWYRAHLPSFEAIAAQLRREAEMRAQDAQAHLELTLRLDEPGTQPSAPQWHDIDDQGPY